MPITINGSGTVTGISAGGLPDGVITTDDIAAGAVTATKVTGGPAFKAYASANTNFTNDVEAKVQLNTEVFDTDSRFDNVTNYRFTPNVAGYYQVNASVYFAQQGSTWYYASARIAKNGVHYAISIGPPFNGNSCLAHVSDLVFLNGTTDYIELLALAVGSGTLPLIGGLERTFMSASFVRPV